MKMNLMGESSLYEPHRLSSLLGHVFELLSVKMKTSHQTAGLGLFLLEKFDEMMKQDGSREVEMITTTKRWMRERETL